MNRIIVVCQRWIDRCHTRDLTKKKEKKKRQQIANSFLSKSSVCSRFYLWTQIKKNSTELSSWHNVRFDSVVCRAAPIPTPHTNRMILENNLCNLDPPSISNRLLLVTDNGIRRGVVLIKSIPQTLTISSLDGPGTLDHVMYAWEIYRLRTDVKIWSLSGVRKLRNDFKPNIRFPAVKQGPGVNPGIRSWKKQWSEWAPCQKTIGEHIFHK